MEITFELANTVCNEQIYYSANDVINRRGNDRFPTFLNLKDSKYLIQKEIEGHNTKFSEKTKGKIENILKR